MAKKFCTRALSVGLSLALCASLVAPALAVTYDIGVGSVFVESDDDGVYSYQGEKTAESINRGNEITVTGTSVYQAAGTDEDGNATPEVKGHTITVTGAAAGTIITLKDLTIDVSGTGGGDAWVRGDAAFSIIGNGETNPDQNIDVTVELDGENTLKSGYCRAGLELSEGASVTIQDKNKDGSSLTATGGAYGAGIGSGSDGTVNTITIGDGADVKAKGGRCGAGIGGSSYGTVGLIAINSAKYVVAEGGDYSGAGIGSGNLGKVDSIIIQGGSKVLATGLRQAAGIGGGNYGMVSSIIIAEGSTVTAIANGEQGSGIGGAANGTIGNILIDGSTVTATGSSLGSGIGGTFGGTTDNITIKNSTVTATGGHDAAGIGGGYGDAVKDITISGSTVTATGGYKGAGIGGSCIGTVGNITVDGGSNVTAIGGKLAASIGAGHSNSSEQNSAVNDIVIRNSTVTAIGDQGIGSVEGYRDNACKAGNITIDDDVTLLALSTNKWAVDPKNADSTVTGNILIGRLGFTPSSSKTVFNVLDKDGNPVMVQDKEGNPVELTFDVKWDGKTYLNFAIDLPDSETDYIIAQKDEDGNIVNYLVYDDNEAFYRTKQDGDTVTPMQQGGLVLKKPGTKYEFVSKDGKELPRQVNNLLNSYKNGSVTEGRVVNIPSAGMKWTFQSSEKTFEGGINKDGKLQDETYTGTWGWDGYDYEVTVKPNNGGQDIVLSGEVGGDKNPTKPTGFIKDGYNLDSWTVRDENGKVLNVDPFAEDFIPSKDGQQIFVEANWEGFDYTVKVDPDGGDLPEGTKTELTGKVGGNSNPTAPEDPSKSGYDFDGWVVVDKDGKPIVDDEGNPINPFDPNFIPKKDGQEIIVKATWKRSPTRVIPGGGVTIEDVAVPLAGLFTRADAIGYLWEQSGEPEWELSDFPDVPEDHQWAVAIGWAQDMGIALPDEEGNFRPDDLVLRSVESLEVSPEGELQEFLNRYAVYAGIVLEPDELFIELGGEWDDVIMGEDAQVIFDDFFAKLEAALAEQAA